MYRMAATTAEVTQAGTTVGTTAEVTQAATSSRRAIVTDWIEGRKTLAIATGTIRITRATFEAAAVHTVRDFVEDTTPVIASTVAIGDSTPLVASE